MRSLFTIGLIVTGCISHDVVAPPVSGIDDVGNPDMDPVGEAPPSSRLVPQLCTARAWRVTPDAKDVDVEVVATPEGATILAVAKTGGPIRGFRVDQRGDQAGAVMTIRDDLAFTDVSASIAGGRLLVTGTAGTTTTLDIVRDDLGDRHELSTFTGALATRSATVRDTRFALVGDSDGLRASGFSGVLWEPSGTQQITSEPIVSITATQHIQDAMIVWSTESRECHLRRVGAARESIRAFPCENASIAMNSASGRGVLVYEESTDVFRTEIRVGGESELANRLRLGEFGSSPRAAFDGTRMWLSYLNVHGDVIVGFIDEQNEFVSRSLEGIRPEAEGYQLASFADGMWVVLSGNVGMGALRVCAVPAPQT